MPSFQASVRPPSCLKLPLIAARKHAYAPQPPDASPICSEEQGQNQGQMSGDNKVGFS